MPDLPPVIEVVADPPEVIEVEQLPPVIIEVVADPPVAIDVLADAVEVIEVIDAGPMGPTGPRGPQGQNSGGLVFRFDLPAGHWPMPHDLGRLPVVTLYSLTGRLIHTDVDADEAHAVATFPMPTPGIGVLT